MYLFHPDDYGALEVVRAVRGFGLCEAEGGRVRGTQEDTRAQDGRPTLQALPPPQVIPLQEGRQEAEKVSQNEIIAQ